MSNRIKPLSGGMKGWQGEEEKKDVTVRTPALVAKESLAASCGDASEGKLRLDRSRLASLLQDWICKEVSATRDGRHRIVRIVEAEIDALFPKRWTSGWGGHRVSSLVSESRSRTSECMVTTSDGSSSARTT